MNNIEIQSGFSSPSGIIAAITGWALVLSVFLPWLSPSIEISSRFSTYSGMGISGILGLAGLSGGLLAIGLVFVPIPSVRGALHVMIGIVALAVLGWMMYNRTLPLFSREAGSQLGAAPGVYVYGISGVILAMVGLIERHKIPAQVHPEANLPAAPVFRVSAQPSTVGFAPLSAVAGSFCGACGTAANNQAAFCGKCGAVLAVVPPPVAVIKPFTQVYCSRCGKPNNGGDFCGGCGSQLKCLPTNDSTG